MAHLLTRLGRALAAYQLADVVAKVIAVVLLPVYTRYIDPQGYGDVELIATAVILVSIVIRLGMIEAFVRFYFADEDPARRDALVRRATVFLLAATTAVAVPALIAADPLSQLVLNRHDAPLLRVAVLGVWTFTNLELAYGVLRVDERIRAYAVASLINVLVTVTASVLLVVAAHGGARGLLLGNYGTSTGVLLVLWFLSRRRLARPPRVARSARPPADRFRALFRFGLPTVPAEASVYALSVVDRFYLLHARSAAFVGLYSIALKLAGGIAFIVRAFQYAWPPLAYSVTDDREAARFYGLVTTYYVLVTGTAIAALALLGRWIVRLLAAPAYHGAATALPWVSLGWALYGLFVILTVVSGRAKVTGRNVPAALAGLAANVLGLVVLTGPLGLAGAGVALCLAYLVMLVVLHLLTRRAFAVAFEWRRLTELVLIFTSIATAGELLLPTRGLGGCALRAAALAAIPAALMLTGFVTPSELAQLRRIPALRRRQPA